MKKFFFFVFTFIFLFSSNCFADNGTSDSKSTATVSEKPQWLKDVRRTEIITFGSLPFVTLWTTVGYSVAVYGEFKNPLDKSTDSFTEDDQFKIIKISAATCVGLGLFDLTYNLIKRAIKHKKGERKQSADIEVLPFSTKTQEELDMAPPDESKLPDYYKFGVESAIF